MDGMNTVSFLILCLAAGNISNVASHNKEQLLQRMEILEHQQRKTESKIKHLEHRINSQSIVIESQAEQIKSLKFAIQNDRKLMELTNRTVRSNVNKINVLRRILTSRTGQIYQKDSNKISNKSLVKFGTENAKVRIKHCMETMKQKKAMIQKKMVLPTDRKLGKRQGERSDTVDNRETYAELMITVKILLMQSLKHFIGLKTHRYIPHVNSATLIGVCSASHTFDTRRGDNESSRLLKRLETLETKQKNDGVRMRKLEADFHRQSGIIEEQNKKIDNLEKTVVKQKSTLVHAFRIARNNRRKISLMRPGLLNMDLFDSGRAHHRLQGDPWSQKKMPSSIKSSITLSKPEGNIKSFNASTSGRQHNGKTNKPNTNHHPYSQNHKAVISNHHQQHSHTDKADKPNHHQQHSHTDKADKSNHKQHSHTDKADKPNHHQQHLHTDTADKPNHHQQHSHTDKADKSNHKQHSHTDKADKSNHKQHSHTDKADKSNHKQHSHTDKADKSNHHQQHSHTVKAHKSNHHQQHLHSHKNKTDTSNHRQQHVHSQTENGTNGSKHFHNSDRTPSHGSRNNYQSHHKQTQSIPKHTNSRIHNSKNTILSTNVHHKHNGGSTLNSHGKDNQVHHHGKHTNEHNGHHSSDSASANHHNKHQSENQETRHAVPSKPRQQRSSMRTSRQSFGGIAFSVYLDHDATISQHQTVKFNKIITNDGDGYDPMTGVFTCAEAGVYMLTFSIGQRDQDHYMWAELMVNSQNLIDAVVDTYHPYQDLQGGNTVLVRLRQGDKVWIDATHNGSHVEGSGTLRLTTFSGLFLYA